MIVETAQSGTRANLAIPERVSDGLEKAFLTEMLKHAGPKASNGSFGGGIGEEQFNSLLTEIYAQSLASRLDLGFVQKANA